MPDFSKWYLSAEGKLMREGWPDYNQPFNIIHLDDHELFRNGLINFCIKPFHPKIRISEIGNGDSAYNFIKNKIDNHDRIDLLITDINHPGLPGHELVIKIREYESLKSYRYYIPILMLSFMKPSILKELQNYTHFKIDQYHSKEDDFEKMVESIDELLYKQSVL